MSGSVPSTRASVSVKLEHATLPVLMCSQTWKLSELHTIGIFNGGFITYVSSIINSISSPSPLSREWGAGMKDPSF